MTTDGSFAALVFYLKPRVGNCVWNREFVIPSQNYIIGVWAGGQGAVNHHAIFQLLPSWDRNANSTLWRKVQKWGRKQAPPDTAAMIRQWRVPSPQLSFFIVNDEFCPLAPGCCIWLSIYNCGWLAAALQGHIFSRKIVTVHSLDTLRRLSQIFLITLTVMAKNSSFF